MFLQIDPSGMFDLVRNVTLDDNTKCSCTDSVVLSWHLDKNELNILPRKVKSYEGVQTKKDKNRFSISGFSKIWYNSKRKHFSNFHDYNIYDYNIENFPLTVSVTLVLAILGSGNNN